MNQGWERLGSVFLLFIDVFADVLICSHGSLVKCLRREVALCNIHVITLSNKNVLSAWYCLLLDDFDTVSCRGICDGYFL